MKFATAERGARDRIIGRVMPPIVLGSRSARLMAGAFPSRIASLDL